MLCIRKAVDADLNVLKSIYIDAMYHLHAQGIQQWSEEYPANHIDEDLINGELFAVLEHDKHVGAVVFNGRADEWHEGLDWRGSNESAMFVHRLVISPEAQGRGLAKRVMSWVHDYARGQSYQWMRLDTFIGNTNAIKLYHSMGYCDVGPLVQFPDYIALDLQL